MGAMYVSVIVCAVVGEIPSIFQGIDEREAPILGEAVQIDEGGFSIRPPAGWDLVKRGGRASFLAPAAGRFRDSLVVKRYHGAKAEAFAELLKKELAKVYEPLRIAGETAFDGAGLEGKILTVDYTEVKAGAILDLRSRYYLVDLEESIIVAVGTARRDRFEGIERPIDESVESLEIFGPGYVRAKDGTCSFPNEGYSFRLRADMSIAHGQYEAVIEFKIGSPGRGVVPLRISREDTASSLRTRARALAARVPGAEVSRYGEAAYECWRILGSKSKSVIYQFVIGKEKNRFLVSATAPTKASEAARDVVEHIVRTFRLLGG